MSHATNITPLGPAAQPVAVAGSRRSRAPAIIFMLIALSAGLTATWLILNYVGRRTREVKHVPVPLVKIVVAASELPQATTLQPEMLTTAEWPVSAVPSGSFQDGAALAGRVTRTALVAGEPLTEARLAPPGSGEGMAAVIPREMRAMTVRVNEVIGVGGFIHPNDLVDVIATMPAPVPQRPGEQELHAKIVLQAIRVAAVGEEMIVRHAKPVKVPVVTLLVTPAEAEQLALASVFGEPRLILRSQSDRAAVATPGVTPRELLGIATSREPTQLAAAAVRKPARGEPEPPRPVLEPPKPEAREAEVVEVLRGDRPLEERRIRPKGKQP